MCDAYNDVGASETADDQQGIKIMLREKSGARRGLHRSAEHLGNAFFGVHLTILSALEMEPCHRSVRLYLPSIVSATGMGSAPRANNAYDPPCCINCQ
jgi:hypothetical protein